MFKYKPIILKSSEESVTFVIQDQSVRKIGGAQSGLNHNNPHYPVVKLRSL